MLSRFAHLLDTKKQRASSFTLHPPDGYIPPRLTLMIVGTPRSGTYFLCDLLSQIKVCGTPTEYFNPTIARSFIPGKECDLLERLLLPSRFGISEAGVASVKFFAWNFDEIATKANLFEFFPNVRFVLVWREDRLAQAVSLAKARQTGRWQHTERERADAFYDPEGIYRALVDILTDHERFELFFARCGVAPLRISYEQLVSDPTRTVAAVCRHAGLEPPADRLERLTVRTERLHDRLSEDWQRRFLAEYGSRPILDRIKVKVRWEDLE